MRFGKCDLRSVFVAGFFDVRFGGLERRWVGEVVVGGGCAGGGFAGC